MHLARWHARHGFRTSVWLGLVLMAILAAGCGTTRSLTPADAAAIDRLLGLIKERLDVAPEVARTKWNTKAPIEDLPREKQIVDGVAKGAPEYGLDPKVAGSFFQAQIEASKIVQSTLHAQWTVKKQPPFPTVADLGKDIRPVLDRLTPAMLRALADAVPALTRPGGQKLLGARSQAILGQGTWPEAAVREAVAPLLALRR